MNRLALLVAALLIALLIPLWLGGGDALLQIRGFPAPLLLAMFAMIILCWLLNAMRLRLLLADQACRLGRWRSVGVVVATEFAICATPGGTGGPLTLMALLGRSGVRPARSSAVFAADQLNDLAFFLFALVAIGIYALFHNLDHKLETLLLFSGLLMGATVLGCAALGRYHRYLVRVAGRLLQRCGAPRRSRLRWARKLLRFVHAFSQTFKLPRRTLAQVFALTCVHWGLRYSVLYLALQGLGAQVQWAWSFLIQMLSLSAGQFSLMPGGAGAAELTSAALLAPLIGKPTAAAAIVLWRAVTYYFYLVAGAPVFLALVGRPLLRSLLRLRQA